MLFVLTGRTKHGRAVCAVGVPGKMIEGLLTGNRVLALDALDLTVYNAIGILRAESADELRNKIKFLENVKCITVATEDDAN